MADLKGIMTRKVAGIPVVYLAAAFAVILIIVAYKMKTAPSADTSGTADGSGAGDAGSGDGTMGGTVTTGDYAGTVYDGLKTTGTVVVAPTPPDVPTTVTVSTNDEWVKNGVEWLVSTNKATGGTALTALTKFINGEALSFDEGSLRDMVIKEKGVPPEPLVNVGSTGEAPAKKQGSPPLSHVVRGHNDNMFNSIAQLYYGSSDQAHVDFLQSANTSLGVNGPFAVGTSVHVPVYALPKYYTATASVRTAPAIAAKNGISVAQLDVLNNGIKFPVKAGTRVRVA